MVCFFYLSFFLFKVGLKSSKEGLDVQSSSQEDKSAIEVGQLFVRIEIERYNKISMKSIEHKV